MRNRKWKKLLFVLLILLFSLAALISACNIVTILSEYRTADRAAEELRQFIDVEPTQNPTETVPPEAAAELPTETEPVDTYPYPEVDFESLLEINADVVGWIYIEDTAINYPVVQGQDNVRYMDRMVDGRYNPAGSIFMDYRNNPDFSDKNSVLYGHHMNNGSMFAQIVDYKKPDFFEAHPMGVIITPEQKFRFEVIAGYVTDVKDDAWQMSFEDGDAFLSWLEDALDRSVIGGSFEAHREDRVITLSTCTYEFDDARFVLVCRILE